MPHLSVPSPPTWEPTPQEEWVWARLCAGEIANFNEAEGYGGKLDPKDPKRWPEKRILRPSFLEKVLLQEPYRSALTHHGVRIVGAWFKGPLDLSHATVSHPLWLAYCRFESDIDLTSIEALRSFLLTGSTFIGTANLLCAKIGVQLNMVGSTFSGLLNMNGMEVEGSLFMREGAKFAEVDLGSAKIGGQLEMTGATFTGPLNMSSMQVQNGLSMRFTEAENSILLVSGKIGGDLDLSYARLASVDLTSTQVGGVLSLGSERGLAPEWRENAEFVLRNTEVGILQDLGSSGDSPDAWPDTVELDDFTYGRFGGFTSLAERSDMAKRKICWFKKWLEKQKTYSPQPYEQLASVLRKAGYKEKATRILYEGKKREHLKATSIFSLTWWWLALQWLFIGYGYRNFQVLIWVGIFCALGMLALHQSGVDLKHKMQYWGFAYSLDMFLPIVELTKPYYGKIMLDGWVRVYFYAHKIFGYVLASFLIAGLSGLTKR